MKHLQLIAWVGLLIGAVANAQPGGRFNGYLRSKPALGEIAPDFLLRDLDDKEVHLQDLVGKRPIVIEFGSYS